MLIGNRFVRRVAVPAVALIVGLTMVGWSLAPSAWGNSPNRLQMHVLNQIDRVLTVNGSNVMINSDNLGVGETEEYKAYDYYDSSANTVRGFVEFSRYTSAGEQQCSATLGFKYEFNHTTGHCDDKHFSPTTTAGSCKVQRQGDCYGAGSCKCNFVVTM